ncbi:MAG: type II CAAX endopeptidase family protein [Candidatus Binatia bacterium]
MPDDLTATDSAASPQPRSIRFVAGTLLVLGLQSLVHVLAAVWRGPPIPLEVQVLAPVAAWGLLRSRQWGWLIAMLLIWSVLLTCGAILAATALGDPMEMTALGLAVRQPLAIAAIGLGGILFYGWLHWLLTRPAVLRIFRPATTRPWGPAGTLALGTVAVSAGQIVGGIAAAWLLDLPPSELQDPVRLIGNGAFLAAMSAVGAPITLATVGLFVWLRHGPSLRDYLGLRPATLRALAVGVGATLVLTSVEHAVHVGLGRPIPDFVANSYRSGADSALLWLAFVVLAPLAEEVVFRGFLLRGLAASCRAGTAIAVTALAFAALHLGQYGALDLGFLTAFGAALAVARLCTGSLLVPITMHATMNLVALLGTAAHFANER